MDLTAFHELVKNGEFDAVKAALAEAPDLLTAKNAAGQSALLLAKYYGRPQVAQYLCELRTELDIYEACAVGDLGAVQRALNIDPSLLESRSPDGWTPLHLTAFFGQPKIAEALIDRGAKMDARSTNRMENTPLHAAAAGGQIELLELLLKHGADVNARQQGGWTALHAASQAGRKEMVLVLLAHSADTEARAENNQSALDLALLGGKAEIVELLESFNPHASHNPN